MILLMNKIAELVTTKNYIKEIGKRSLYVLSIPFYQITSSQENNFVFFLIQKTGISTINSVLRSAMELDNDMQTVIYSKRFYRNHFKFCFIRNPWDRLVSCYTNKVIRKKLYPNCWDKDFDYFVQYLETQHLPTGEGHIRLQSASFPLNDIDFIGRFENFDKDFNIVINEKLKLDKEPVVMNPSKHKHYTEYYNDQTRNKVAQLYKADIDLGNYKFGY